MDNWLKSEEMKKFKQELDNLMIRHWIKSAVKNYDKEETYIIYDGSRIEIYDEEFFKIRKAHKHFKSFLVSRPIKIV